MGTRLTRSFSRRVTPRSAPRPLSSDALGILSGHMRRRRMIPWRGGIRRWAPLAAGVMLLVYLGFGGERTDVGAHVAGFAVGGVLGLALAHFSAHVRQGPRAQRLYGLLSCSLVSLAWLLALQARDRCAAAAVHSQQDEGAAARRVPRLADACPARLSRSAAARAPARWPSPRPGHAWEYPAANFRSREPESVSTGRGGQIGHSPLNTGRRFSLKARIPSR